MYKKIMVAVDGSEITKQVLAEAENIANSYNATLCIVHSIGNDNKTDKKGGSDILEQASSSVRVLNIETYLLEAEGEYGSSGVSDAIAAAAAKWEVDLLVVGTANRKGLARFIVGSVAEQLVTKVNSSILLVRPPKD